jgi:hypothetical protein
VTYDSAPPETVQAARLVAVERYAQALQQSLTALQSYLAVAHDHDRNDRIGGTEWKSQSASG